MIQSGLQNSVLLKKNEVNETTTTEIGARRSYHEIPGLQHETRDVLKQLNFNVQLLEDMCGRLGFVLTEVRGLIRR